MTLMIFNTYITPYKSRTFHCPTLSFPIGGKLSHFPPSYRRAYTRDDDDDVGFEGEVCELSFRLSLPLSLARS